MTAPDDITRLPERLRSTSLRWASTGFAAMFAVGTGLGVYPLLTGEDPGAFFAPGAVFVVCTWAAVEARRGHEVRARRAFSGVLLSYITATMLFAPADVRLSVVFPIASLVLFLFHLLHAPPASRQLGVVMSATMAAGYLPLFATYGVRDRIDVTAAVVQVLALAFANFVLDRMARGWITALEAVLVAREAEGDANRAKSVFLANMSHELRTPLNAIIGYAELVQEQITDDGAADSDDLGRIHASGHHLLGLVNQVLDLSRIEAGRLELERAEIDVAKLVMEVCDTLRPAAERTRNRVDVDVEPVPALFLDPMRLRQIVTNLLANAVKFTQGGTIEVSVARSGDGVRIRVRDNGPGIPKDRLEAIFKPFEQASTEVQRTYGGTGLGLAISRKLAREMGGDIVVDSAPGAGATFDVWFPRTPTPLVHAAPSRATPKPGVAAA